MIDRYVVSKSQKVQIPCDGPLTAQNERLKLEAKMKAAGYPLDVEIEFRKKPLPRAHTEGVGKRSHK